MFMADTPTYSVVARHICMWFSPLSLAGFSGFGV